MRPIRWSAPAKGPGVHNQTILPIRTRWVDCNKYRQPRGIAEIDPTKSAVSRHKWVLVVTTRRVVVSVNGRERQWA